jgi:hypothetical protein
MPVLPSDFGKLIADEPSRPRLLFGSRTAGLGSPVACPSEERQLLPQDGKVPCLGVIVRFI